MEIYVYIKLIHSVVQQKLTQHCKLTNQGTYLIREAKRKKRKSENSLRAEEPTSNETIFAP